MTLYEYLNYPMGKGTSLGLSEIKNYLDKDYENLRYNMSLKVFYLKERYLVYLVNVPSRHAKGLFYQVVYQFDLKGADAAIRDVKHLAFQCFSNCPSFTYTYSEVFKEKGLLIDWSKQKLNREAIRNKPETRNPQRIVSYERSLYLAGKYILNSGRTRVGIADMGATRINTINFFLNNIITQDEIEIKYKELTAKKEPSDSRKRIDKIPDAKAANYHKGLSGLFTHSTKSTKSTKSTHSSSVIKKTKKI